VDQTHREHEEKKRNRNGSGQLRVRVTGSWSRKLPDGTPRLGALTGIVTSKQGSAHHCHERRLLMGDAL
jgi:hypothetical protein